MRPCPPASRSCMLPRRTQTKRAACTGLYCTALPAGFCYINDCVLGILELLKHHPRCAVLPAACRAAHCCRLRQRSPSVSCCSSRAAWSCLPACVWPSVDCLSCITLGGCPAGCCISTLTSTTGTGWRRLSTPPIGATIDDSVAADCSPPTPTFVCLSDSQQAQAGEAG